MKPSVLITYSHGCWIFTAGPVMYADESSAPSYHKARNSTSWFAKRIALNNIVLWQKYFRAQQTKYQRQAQEEKAEWERRSQNVTGPAAKYPRPVDSSRDRYEYFEYKVGLLVQNRAS